MSICLYLDVASRKFLPIICSLTIAEGELKKPRITQGNCGFSCSGSWQRRK